MLTNAWIQMLVVGEQFVRTLLEATLVLVRLGLLVTPGLNVWVSFHVLLVDGLVCHERMEGWKDKRMLYKETRIALTRDNKTEHNSPSSQHNFYRLLTFELL